MLIGIFISEGTTTHLSVKSETFLQFCLNFVSMSDPNGLEAGNTPWKGCQSNARAI